MLEKIDSKKYQKLIALARHYPKIDVSSIETAIALLTAGRRLEAAMETNLGRYNMSRCRFSVLIELLATGDEGKTPAELAEAVEVSRGTMTGLLDALAKDDLVIRVAGADDRRSVTVKITPAGTAFAEKILPENFRRSHLLMEELSLSDKETLVGLLAKVLNGLKAYQDL